MPRTAYKDVLRDPTKGVSLEEKVGRTKEKLSEPDRRALQNQVLQREEEILAKKDMNKDADVSAMQKEIEHKKMILAHDEDLNPKTGYQTDRLAARAKEIEGILKKEMPTKREMWPKAGSVEAQQAIRHNLKFQNDRDALCKEWQDIQKKLNPDDPYAQSLELIRPD